MKPKLPARHPRLKALALALAACLASLHAGSGAAPQGGTVVFGQASLQARPNGLDITQGSAKAIIDWNRFSLASGELLRIDQPSASAVLLNRVTGTDPSIILGQIQANGRVFLSNPRGIVLGQGSRIDAGGFVATTLNLGTQDFLAGRIQPTAEPGSTPGRLQADGVITAPGGTIALVAPELSVTGSLQAQRIGLAAASHVLVDVEGDGLIFFNARNDGLPARLQMLGQLNAEGGTAELRAQARAGFADTVLNLDGIVQARSLGQRGGQVVIDGGTDGITAVSGRIDVSGAGAGEHGGSATVLGRQVALVGQATVDASGMAGGGSIRIGGGFQGEGTAHNAQQSYLGAQTLLKADAQGRGDGGRIVVWSDDATHYFGRLSARGGAAGGDGGFAEVSGKLYLDFSGQSDLGAALGRVGTLLLDPVNLTILVTATPHVDGSAGVADLSTASLLWSTNRVGNESSITPGAIVGLLAANDVRLEASGNMMVSDPISSAAVAAKSLSLLAGNNLSVNADISILGALTLAANQAFASAGGSAASGSGRLAFAANTTMTAGSITLESSGTLTLPSLVAATSITATATTTTAGTVITGSIAQAGVLGTGADGSLFTASGSIDLDSETNLFGSNGVAFNTVSGDVSVKSDGLKLAASSLGGKLLATATTGGITQTGALDLGADGSVFTTSTAGQAITLTQANALNGKTVALASGGAASLSSAGELILAASSVGGALTAVTGNGAIRQTGILSTGAAGSSFTAGGAGSGIDLSTHANQLAGMASGGNTFSTPGELALRDVNSIRVPAAAASLSGRLVLISDSGSITQTGAFSVGADGSAFTTRTAGQTITLTQANLLNGRTVALHSGGDATLHAEAIRLAASTVGGQLTAAAATGGISQTGVLSLGADGSTFTASSSGQSIALTQANVFNGRTVALTTSGAAGDASLSGDALRLAASSIGGKLTATAGTGTITQTGALNLGADGSTFTTSTAGQAITLTQANVLNGRTVSLLSGGDGSLTADAIKFAASTLGGRLTATASTGGITQTGLLSLGADGSTFSTSSANQTIALTLANLLGGRSVGFNTSGSGGDVNLSGNALKLGASSIGGKLTATASTGAISQSGALSLGADGSTFTTSTAGQAVTLTQANVLNGRTVALHSGGGASLTADAITLAASSVGGALTATASTGAIVQTGAFSVGADGSSFTTSSAAQAITLTQANLFNGRTVALHSGGDASLNGDALKLAAGSVAGKLLATAATGAISQTGALSLGADGSVFTALTAGQGLTLTQANVFNGRTVVLSTSGDASLSADAIRLAASTIGGKLVATAGTGTITQTGALNLGADGSTFTTSTAGQAITLTQANVLNGKTVALHSGGDASLTADAVKLAASAIGGKLTAIASGGSISQSGVLSLGAEGSAFSAMAAGQGIALTQANLLGGRSVALNTGGDVSLSGDAIKLAASSIGGKLLATASTGPLTQSGALNLGADGSTFTTSTAGQAITLTQANVLNGRTVSLDSGGNASLTADAIRLAASTVAGSLGLSASTGGIRQTGALSVGADGSSFSTSAAGQTIELGLANRFHGRSVALASRGAVSITADALTLAGGSLVGPLSVTATSGGIGQSGALNLGADGNSFSGQTISLGQANILNGKTVALHSSGDASLSADAILLAASTVGGKLVATAGTGSITQAGALSLGADGSSFSGQTITLTAPGNAFAGKSVALHSSGDASLVADALVLGASTVGGKLVATATSGGISQTGALVLGADGSAFTGQTIALPEANVLGGKTLALSSSGDASLAGDAITLAASSIGGALNLQASASIAQAGALTVGGLSSLGSSGGTAAVTLADAANQFTGGVLLAGPASASIAGAGTLTVSGDAGQLSLGGAGALVLGGGRYTSLSLSSGTGISQTGAITVTGLLQLTTTGPTPMNVSLGSANELQSVRLNTGGSFGSVQLRDADLHADGLALGGSASQLTVTGAGGVTLDGGSYGSLDIASSAGTVLQTSAVTVTGTTWLDAGGGDVLLSLAGNDFATLVLSQARNASLADANDLTLTSAQASASLSLAVPGTVQFSGDFTGTARLIKQGSGLLLVNSGLSNLGGTALQAGTLVLAGPGAHLGPGTLALGSASTLELRDGAVLTNALQALGGLIRGASGSNRIDGSLSLRADTVLHVDAGASLRLSGAITETGGARGLSKTGDGLLQLSGSDSRTGATRITQGQVLADGAGALSASSALTVSATLTLAIDQAIGSLSGAGSVVLGAHQLASGGDQSSTVFAGSLTGSGGLHKLGSGSLTLSGSNTQSGGTQVQAGTLVLAAGSAQADGTALSVATGATLALAADETLGALAGSGSIALGSHRLTLNTAAADGSFAGSIGGSGGLSKTGAGTQTLAGSGSWGAETRVEGGRLLLAGAGALPSANSVNVAAGATLQTTQALSLAALDGAGIVLLDDAARLSVGAQDASSQFTGSLQGSGGLSKTGSGSLALAGANTFSGPVSVSGGSLVLRGGSALADTAELALAAGGTLTLQTSETFARLSGSGEVRLDNSARLSLGGDGADSHFAGSLTGSGSLAKQGSGTLSLSGNNSHAGGTLIEAGSLQLGNGGATGSLGSGAVTNNGLLRLARSGDSTLDNALGGSGGLEQTLGSVTLSSPQNSYAGATKVSAGSLLTSGAERLPDGSAVQVAAGASLTLRGNETLGSLAAEGAVVVQGNVTSSGGQRYGAGLTISSASPVSLQAGGALDAQSSANQLGSQPLNITAQNVQLRAPQDLSLGTVLLAQGGQISAEHLLLQGALTLSGGTLDLIARAAPDEARSQLSATAIIPGTNKPLALAEATLTQAAGSTLNVAAGASLALSALGSIELAQEGNQVTGGISLLSGPAFNTAWAPNLKAAFGLQRLIRLAGQQLNIAGLGLEGDLVEISAVQLATVEAARIVARLPYDNVASGTTLSQPGLRLTLLPAAFDTAFTFGGSGDAGIRVSVGARETGARTEGPDSGFLTVAPLGGARGSTAVFLVGPEPTGAGAGYSLFHDGAAKQSEIPVFYNNVLPAVPQLTSALSSVASVSESARRDRFEEAVRTENVTVRLRAGVIAEVGPGRAATTGSGGVQAPPSCDTLACSP